MNTLQKNISLNICFFIFTLLSIQAQNCDIAMDNDASVEIHDNANITFYGTVTNEGEIETRANSNTTFTENLINDGDFRVDTNQEGGRITFDNNSKSLSISGSNTPEFSELTVSVRDSLILNVPVDVTTGLFFDEGLIITPRNTADISINLKNDAIDANEADARHVDGYISYTGDDAYTFPVGDDNRLRPLSTEERSSINTSKAAYFFENPNNPVTFPLDFDLEEKDDQISNISPFEFWDFDGSVSTRVTLTWDIMSNISSRILNSNNLNELIVVGWSKEEQKWINLGNTSITGDINSGSITSTTFNPDDYEVLTFARNRPDDIEIPELTVFNGLSTGDNDKKNDYLTILNISQFPNNTLKIYNRWGVKVFDVDGYDAEPKSSPNFKEPTNPFIGKSNGRITINEDDLLPVGTYYYVLTYDIDGQGGEKTLAGYLYINR